jgi:hypothetical protein
MNILGAAAVACDDVLFITQTTAPVRLELARDVSNQSISPAGLPGLAAVRQAAVGGLFTLHRWPIADLAELNVPQCDFPIADLQF